MAGRLNLQATSFYWNGNPDNTDSWGVLDGSTVLPESVDLLRENRFFVKGHNKMALC